ncbi:MAG: DUF362 domain-containing protein [Candidatus Hodarchaeota archaeon]
MKHIYSYAQSIERKLSILFDAAAEGVVSKGDLVAIKMHFGEPGNNRLILPEHVRVIVQKVKEAGGEAFVTDSTGIGLASARGTAHSLLKAAVMHGYTPDVIGAPLVVADGLKGFSGVKVKVNGLRLKEVDVAQAIAEADSLVSLAHVKGHPRTGLAGALKNIGVGGLTKCGRAPLHLANKPQVNLEKCSACEECVSFCPTGAITISDSKPTINHEKCIWGCGCWDTCPENAISGWFEMHHDTNTELCIRVADAAAAIINHLGRDKVVFFNLAYNITPHCDCLPYGDMPIVPDIGILASRDPVAIDKASIDMINNSPEMPGSASSNLNAMDPHEDKLSRTVLNYPPFKSVRPRGPDWRSMIEAAFKLGLGNIEYELIPF